MKAVISIISFVGGLLIVAGIAALAGVFEEERILNEDYVAAKCVPEGPIQTEVTEDPFRGKRFNGVAMVTLPGIGRYEFRVISSAYVAESFLNTDVAYLNSQLKSTGTLNCWFDPENVDGNFRTFFRPPTPDTAAALVGGIFLLCLGVGTVVTLLWYTLKPKPRRRTQ